MVDAKEIIEKYKKKLGKELGSETKDTIASSATYTQFKKEQLTGLHSFYERACIFAEKTIKVTPAQKDVDKVEPYIKLAHLNISARSVFSLTYLATLVVILLFSIIGLLTFNLMIIFGGLIFALSLLLILPGTPKKIFNAWRAKASDQLVLAVLYMVIYMEHTPNLERAVEFVAKHMPPPISLDFIKLLWDVETKKYSSIKEALDSYVGTWRDHDDEFVEAIQLIQSSLMEPVAEEKQKTLEKAVQRILEGTQDHMISYAHNLQSPIQSLHMLGIVLPVMGLVMLPMVTAFLGESIQFEYLIFLYNILLPILVYGVGSSVLANRPAGSVIQDIFIFKKAKYQKAKFLGLKMPPWLISTIVFTIVALPSILYFSTFLTLPAEERFVRSFSLPALLFSVEFVCAIGFALAAYYRYKITSVIKLRRKVEAMEKEFTTAAFQLGNRLQENIPAELAFPKVAETMEKSEIANFFKIIEYNIEKLGVSFKDAIYNEKYGALKFYPSALIKNCMFVLTEGVKKGPLIAGRSMITISRYLNSLHRVNERLKDLLADTVSSMSMQVKVFVPLISGIVVGLAALTTTILLSLRTQLAGLEQFGAPGAGATTTPGAGLLDVFQIEGMLPTPLFQIIVGLYLIQITYVISFLLSGIIHGHDKIEEQYLIGQNLFISVLLYLIITIVTAVLFSGLAAPISSLQFGT